jgi:50S ribosomal protein L16 3-hydroxylase
MTYSIGFRAPSRGDLIDGWCDHLVDTLVEDDRYADPGLKPQANPGEIAPAALDRLHAMVTQALTDRAAFARWFGAHATTAKYPEADWSPDETVDAADVRALLTEGAALERNPASRFAYVAQPEGVTLFVDGESFDCAGEVARFAQNLCAYGPIGDVPTEALPLLAALLNQGSLILEADDA